MFLILQKKKKTKKLAVSKLKESVPFILASLCSLCVIHSVKLLRVKPKPKHLTSS